MSRLKFAVQECTFGAVTALNLRVQEYPLSRDVYMKQVVLEFVSVLKDI